MSSVELTEAEEQQLMHLRGLQSSAAMGKLVGVNQRTYARDMGELIGFINKLRRPFLPKPLAHSVTKSMEGEPDA